jgi:hypothetical protein
MDSTCHRLVHERRQRHVRTFGRCVSGLCAAGRQPRESTSSDREYAAHGDDQHHHALDTRLVAVVAVRGTAGEDDRRSQTEQAPSDQTDANPDDEYPTQRDSADTRRSEHMRPPRSRPRRRATKQPGSRGQARCNSTRGQAGDPPRTPQPSSLRTSSRRPLRAWAPQPLPSTRSDAPRPPVSRVPTSAHRHERARGK